MPARARVIAAGKDAPQGNPCFAKGTEVGAELDGGAPVAGSRAPPCPHA